MVVNLLIYWAVAILSAMLVFGLALAFGILGRRARWILSVLILFAYAGLVWLRPGGVLLSNGTVLLAAAAAGSLIGDSLRGRRAVMVFVVTAAVVDFFSFSGGLTRRIIDAAQSGNSVLLNYLVIRAPVDGRMAAVLGLGDLLILAVLMVALEGLGYSRWAAIGIPLAGLLLAIAVGTLVGGIYGLPFLAASVLIGLWLLKPARLPGVPGG